MAPRALVIAYDFPPHGAIGTMRTLRVVRQLRAEGWDVDVLTGSPDTYLPGTPVEPALEAQVPGGVQILRVPAVRPVTRLQALLRPPRRASRAGGSGGAGPTPAPTRRRGALRAASDFVDAALDIPDKESGWIAPAVAAGLRRALAARTRPDVLYSSAPPWSGQAVALAVASASRLPWVADFRDPWARAPWRDWRYGFRQRAAAALERRVVRRADAVQFVTRDNLGEFAAFYGASAAVRFHLVPNGCDPTELERTPVPAPRSGFVLLHAGTLYGARNPMPVIEAIARAVARGALDAERFRLRLIGTVNLTTDLAAACRRLGISGVVEFAGRVTREESLREMKAASALLLVQTGTTMSIPAKAYEYLAAGRPVLALSEEGETSELVRASGVGIAVRPDEPVDAVERALLAVVALARDGFTPAPRALYDGREHAKTTVRLLAACARRSAGIPAGAPAGIPAGADGLHGPASGEEPTR